jgi:hypothetical protein
MVKTAAHGSKLRKRFQVLALSHSPLGQRAYKKTLDLVKLRIWLAKCSQLLSPLDHFEALRSRFLDVYPARRGSCR